VPPRDRDSLPLPPGLVDLKSDDLVEICPAGQDIAHAIAKRLADHGGVALIIDYGHAESAAGDTLQAVKGHEYASVLEDPGEADLTAHVDFAALAHAAFTGGAQAWGPVPQGHFLTALGLEARAHALMSVASAEQQHEIESAAKRLVDPQQMGALFKVLALTPKGETAPPVFD
jgi:NADH dehydrogenase [ubiquinone] 1 alpha subcomplex assembly factor 7